MKNNELMPRIQKLENNHVAGVDFQFTHGVVGTEYIIEITGSRLETNQLEVSLVCWKR